MKTSSDDTVIVRLVFPWWGDLYMNLCMMFARLHGMEPDLERIADTIVKHIKVKRV